MEPWEDEAERTRWGGVLVAAGASVQQAEVARLAHLGYRNEQIATFQRRSVSSVKEDVRILFVILGVKEHDRHTMGRVAMVRVDVACPRAAQHAAPKPDVPLPELKLARRRKGRTSAGGRRDPGRPDDPSATEAPRA